MPFIALLALQYGHVWGIYFLMTAAPKFMNEVLGFNLGAAGLVASLPYVVRLFSGIAFGALGDYSKSLGWITQLTVRRLSTVVSHIIPGIFLLAIPLVSPYPMWCVAMITLSFAFNGAITMSGYQNVHELAPNYTSTIMSIIVTISTTSGYMSPMVVAYFTREKV